MTSFPSANPPCMKRLSSVSHNEPAQKRPPTPLGEKVVESEVSTRLGTRRVYVETNRNYHHACVDSDFLHFLRPGNLKAALNSTSSA